MTVLNLHKKECLEIAKGVLKTNIDTPILAKPNSNYRVNYIIFIDGEKLAENLKLKVKSSLKKIDQEHVREFIKHEQARGLSEKT